MPLLDAIELIDEQTTITPDEPAGPETSPSGHAAQNYSLTFSVDYPERLSRLKTAFRLTLVIPILVVGPSWSAPRPSAAAGPPPLRSTPISASPSRAS